MTLVNETMDGDSVFAKGNEAAFPHVRTEDQDQVKFHAGLTKREWFAGMALQGIVSTPHLLAGIGRRHGDGNENVASYCYALADALIAAGKEPV